MDRHLGVVVGSFALIVLALYLLKRGTEATVSVTTATGASVPDISGTPEACKELLRLFGSVPPECDHMACRDLTCQVEQLTVVRQDGIQAPTVTIVN